MPSASVRYSQSCKISAIQSSSQSSMRRHVSHTINPTRFPCMNPVATCLTDDCKWTGEAVPSPQTKLSGQTTPKVPGPTLSLRTSSYLVLDGAQVSFTSLSCFLRHLVQYLTFLQMGQQLLPKAVQHLMFLQTVQQLIQQAQ